MFGNYRDHGKFVFCQQENDKRFMFEAQKKKKYCYKKLEILTGK